MMTNKFEGRNVRISVRRGKNAWDDKCVIGRKAGGVQRHGSSCRKTFPFVFSVEGLCEEEASELFLRWVDEAEAAGATRIGDGDFKVTYWEDTMTFDAELLYPKDFDADPATQRAEVQHQLRVAARRAREVKQA